MVPEEPADTVALAAASRHLVTKVLEDAVASYLAGFVVPGVFGGLAVGDDARADVAHTVGLLHAAGAATVAGMPCAAAVATALGDIVGASTDSFASYRVAETLARFGPRHDNAVLAALPEEAVAEVVAAVDSRSLLPMLDDGRLPPNYAAVLARCELARHAFLDEPVAAATAELVDRVAALLGRGSRGLLDDSTDRIGRYDIYAADVVLFTEPFAEQLGEPWLRAAVAARELLELVAAADGSAVPWGRSTGALGLCLTVEFAALVAGGRIGGDAAWWAAAAATALDTLADGWFEGGLVTAHRRRSPYGYRGPHRWIQMTFDCLGKLAWAANALDGAAVSPVALPWQRPDVDVFVPFEDERPLGVWVHRSAHADFVVPVTGSARSDYVATPRQPGRFDVPVDSDVVAGVPVVVADGRPWCGAGVPASLTHERGRLTVHWDRLTAAGRIDADGGELAGSVTSTYEVVDRTVTATHVVEVTHGEARAVALAVPEAEGVPLRVAFSGDGPLRTATVPTSGMRGWRSFWSELPLVHEASTAPAPRTALRVDVTPKLRVLTSHRAHHYQRSLYGPLADRVADGQIPSSVVDDPVALRRVLRRWDVFHMHWPEWFLGPDVARNRRVVETIRGAGVPIVWTQHNLVPHSRDGRMTDAYGVWAAAADVVLHHSSWGMTKVRDRLPFRPDARHAVVPHGHFGNFGAPLDPDDRRARRRHAERELGLRPDVALRLGVVGAPRPEKDVQSVLDAVAGCTRRDIELVVTSLAGDERVPEDPRIVVARYDFVDREEYELRLCSLDALVMPFSDGELLTTGTVGDAVAHALPVLAGPWPFLREVLGDAAIAYGTTAADLAATLDDLDGGTLARAAAAAASLREVYAWEVVAETLWTELVAAAD